MSSRWMRGPGHRTPLTLGSDGGLMVLAAGLVPLLLVVALVPRPLVLPVFALTAFAASAIAAFMAWKRNERWHLPGVTLWDVSGALVLLGCASGIFSKPENALALFGVALGP
jgi:hypothetical protein